MTIAPRQLQDFSERYDACYAAYDRLLQGQTVHRLVPHSLLKLPPISICIFANCLSGVLCLCCLLRTLRLAASASRLFAVACFAALRPFHGSLAGRVIASFVR